MIAGLTPDLRTDIFEQEGIKVDPLNWPWDEYAALAKQLTKDDMQGTAIAGVKHQLDAYWTARYWPQGGHLMSQDWQTALPERDTAVKSLQMIIDLMPYMPAGVMSYDIPDENTAFVQGKVAMAELWPSLIRGTANDPAQSKVVGKWGILPYPAHSPQLSSWSLAIPQTSEKKDLAWEWIKFYTSKEKQLSNFTKYSILPSRISVWQLPQVKTNKLYPHWQASQQGAVIWWRIPAGTMAETYVRDAVSTYITNQWGLSKAASYMEDGFRKLLDEYPPAPGVKNTGR